MCDMNTAGMAHGGWGCTLERSGREHVRRRAALVSKAPDLREALLLLVSMGVILVYCGAL